MKYTLFFLFTIFYLTLWAQQEKNETNNNIQIQNTAAPSSTNGSYNVLFNSEQSGKVKIKADSVVYVKEKSNSKITSTNKKSEINKDSSKESKLISTKTSYSTLSKSANTQSTQRGPTEEQQIQLEKFSDELMNLDSSSFDANFTYYEVGNYDIKRQDYLDKASKISPYNQDVMKYQVANAIIQQDSLKAKEIINAMATQNMLTPDIQSYGNDMLVSSCGNTTLVTHGFVDTYGATFNQLNQTVLCNSSQITIVSLDFMRSKDYRKLLEDKGYDLPKSEKIDVLYLKEFCEKNEEKNIALSMTLPRPYLEPLVPRLSPIGVVFEYRNQQLRTFEEIEECWKNKLNKKNLRGYSSPTSDKLSANYLPTMFFLLKYYHDTGQIKKENEMENEIIFVKQKAGLIQKKKGYR